MNEPRTLPRVARYLMPPTRIKLQESAGVPENQASDHSVIQPHRRVMMRDTAREAVVAELGDDLTPYLAGKATIRFTTENPLSADVVTRIVKVRLAENAARGQR